MESRLKTLLILRHAKSSWDDESLDDHERPLNKRGQRDVLRMGQWIADQDLVPEVILSSTAVRAKLTAQGVADACGFAGKIHFSSELYHASYQNYLREISHVEKSCGSVMIVGHNPGLEILVNFLSGQETLRFPTAALAYFQYESACWKDIVRENVRAQLIQLWKPKELF